MSSLLSTQSPLTYNQWIATQQSLIPGSEQREYTRYLISWYKDKSQEFSFNQNAIKENYIQLVKDLSFLFGQAEQDLFLNSINYSNEEELVLAIPFFAKKLKEISKVLVAKREAVKRAKLKYNLIGSLQGVETLLYEYLLKGFTKKEGSITQVPALPIQNLFPELSAVRDNFYIEIEELHDPTTYHDSDPSVNLEDYVSLSDVLNAPPFDDPSLTEDQITALLATRFLPKAFSSPLSEAFQKYLSEIPNLSSIDLFNSSTQILNNEIVASQKYLGETVYGLTAIRLRELNEADAFLELNLTQGNNWFYWPSGNQVINPTIFNNYYEPIYINSSNFVASSATGGTDFTNSDLIFTDKNGFVEGAWLKGITVDDVTAKFRIKFLAGQNREFLYPFAGFNLTTKGFAWNGYSYTDDHLLQFSLLPPVQQQELLTRYYTGTLPTSSSVPIYLNQTKLREIAYAESFSDSADFITKQSKPTQIDNIYNDELLEPTEQAYLYKFQTTDLPIAAGNTTLLWPIDVITDNNIPLTLTNKDCIPTRLIETNPAQTMTGAIGGETIDTADIIYKLDSRSGEPIEAAWLRSGSINFLDILKDSKPIYNISAVECALPVDGPVQSSLSFKVRAGEKVSFIWMGPDTFADEVFKFYKHNKDCPYARSSPHNYYNNQDFINPLPILNPTPWDSCNCRSTRYSPIGHEGNKFTDYNGVADYLYADPQGLGSNFTINTWKDTRGLSVYNSPQFSYFKLNPQNSVTPTDIKIFNEELPTDKEIGWGPGTWNTSTGTRMILKTGRRYTYYRTSLRKGFDNSPYFVAKLPYPKINSLLCPDTCSDVIFAVDTSLSEVINFPDTINLIKLIYEKLLQINNNNQVGVVAFNQTASMVSYLSNDLYGLKLLTSLLKSSGKTNITDALTLSKYLLTTRIPEESAETFSFFDLCKKLNAVVTGVTAGSQTVNIPRRECKKYVIVFSDGEANVKTDELQNAIDSLKDTDITVVSVDIGPLGLYNDLMERLASTPSYYFNLEKYLYSGDGDQNAFAEYVAKIITNCPPIIPTWYKASRTNNGQWIGLSEPSDMILYPGDYISYLHRSGVQYTSPTNSSSNFIQPGIDFTINIKLNGWDYTTNTFSPTSIGDFYGAKPFWALSYNIPDEDNSFYKETISFGGQIRFFNDYVPLHQPQISQMVLNNSDFIRYSRRTVTDLNWQEDVQVKVEDNEYQWNKIVFYKDVSNLAELLKVNSYDAIGYGTNEPSNILLESYSLFKPAIYNYYARNGFQYVQNLYEANRCLNSFVIFNTGVAIEPLKPYANLDNRFYPTIASVSYPKLAVTQKQVGEYMTPDRLGTSSYRGRGYNIKVDGNMVSTLESVSAEEIFLSVSKYGPRNRGLTKKDQLAPVSISKIDNSWIMEPFSSGSKAGIILGTLFNQKYTPYQTGYETHGMNYFGVNRQDDLFQFWTQTYPSLWNDPQRYPLTFRQELEAETYEARIAKLLVNVGTVVEWKTDLFGFDYELYK
jgi:hypothetical protein